MHFPAIPALIIFSIASTVITTPLQTPGVADATTDVIALAEQRSEIVTREAKGIEKRNEDIMERQNLGCPICCCSDCYDGCFKADVAEREEDVGKRNETIVKRQNLGCPICCCSDCYDGCF